MVMPPCSPSLCMLSYPTAQRTVSPKSPDEFGEHASRVRKHILERYHIYITENISIT